MKKPFLFLLFSLSIFSASARILSVRATLNGANVVPAVTTTATGTLTGTYDDVSKLLSFTVTFSGLSASVTDSYIGEGAVGESGTLLHYLNVSSSPYSVTIGPLSNAHSTAVLTGNSFIELRTSPSDTPEIRGQLIIGMEIFNNAARNNFYGIGGYSYSQTSFPNGIHANPYVVSGPSPQNDFSYAVSAVGGINNIAGLLCTATINTAMSLVFFGNNVRKFGCRVKSIDLNGQNEGSEDIRLTVTTNLGNTASQTGNLFSTFLGFNVINENEYIVSITAEFVNPTPTQMVTLRDIIIGDNSQKNVALNFDGDNDYVSIPSNAGNNTGNYASFTVTCWIKPDATQPTSAVNPSENDIISKWAGLDAGANNNYPFVVRYLNTTRANAAERGKILVGIWDGTHFPTIVSTTAVNDGKWHHVAFVKTNTTNTLTLYIDGVPNGSITNTITNTTINTTPLQIGRRGNGQNYFRGDIDEVRIWSSNKSQADIQAEMFCKNPNTTALQAAYNFSNGVPHGNNSLITQVQDASISVNHGTLNNFTKTGDASNFVTGQVKYVSGAFSGANNGSSWANGFDNLQSALSNNTCNDLFEVYVAKGFMDYKPSTIGNISESFNIPSGMRIYGGFAGTEKSINERNLALIHSTHQTTLSGDLFGNDTPFNFTVNRGDNSILPVKIIGDNVVFDGFTVKGSSSIGVGIYITGTNATIRNSRITDNAFIGLNTIGENATISHCSSTGNNTVGIFIENSTAIIKESLIANNGSDGIEIYVSNGTRRTSITNSTIASNADYGIKVNSNGGTSTNTLKNSLIYGNASGGILNVFTAGTISNTINYSLVQDLTGHLDGNTVNPQFVSPVANTVRSDAGDYRLKWCSKAIGAGTNTGISPLDLDRNPRNFNGTADMGAYEFLGNTPSQVNNSNITGTIDAPTYTGGAIQTITSTAKILAPAGKIDFKAPNAILLSPGFEARGVGQYFQAQIGPNVACSN